MLVTVPGTWLAGPEKLELDQEDHLRLHQSSLSLSGHWPLAALSQAVIDLEKQVAEKQNVKGFVYNAKTFELLQIMSQKCLKHCGNMRIYS